LLPTQIKGQNNGPTEADFQKQAALSFAQGRLHDLLNVAEDTSAFVKMIKDYSPTGTYDINQEIKAEDFSKLFTYDYDRTEGAILSRVNLNDININIDNLQAGNNGDYDARVNQFEKKALSTYSSYGATYGLAEILPGYQLHAKIIGKDV
jgi:hypothetical protein